MPESASNYFCAEKEVLDQTQVLAQSWTLAFTYKIASTLSRRLRQSVLVSKPNI